MTEPAAYGFLAGTFVGFAAGYVGSLMVLKRMALVGDALSHVAFPGLARACPRDFVQLQSVPRCLRVPLCRCNPDVVYRENDEAVPRIDCRRVVCDGPRRRDSDHAGGRPLGGALWRYHDGHSAGRGPRDRDFGSDRRRLASRISASRVEYSVRGARPVDRDQRSPCQLRLSASGDRGRGGRNQDCRHGPRRRARHRARCRGEERQPKSLLLRAAERSRWHCERRVRNPPGRLPPFARGAARRDGWDRNLRGRPRCRMDRFPIFIDGPSLLTVARTNMSRRWRAVRGRRGSWNPTPRCNAETRRPHDAPAACLLSGAVPCPREIGMERWSTIRIWMSRFTTSSGFWRTS